MQEWRIPPWANHIAAAIPCPNVRTHCGYKSPPPAKARRWFPRATRRLPARERRCASSHGPSKSEEQKNPDLRSSCLPICVGSPTFPHTREEHNRFAADKATAGCPGRARGAPRKYWRQREDGAGQLRPAEIVRPHRLVAGRFPANVPQAESGQSRLVPD